MVSSPTQPYQPAGAKRRVERPAPASQSVRKVIARDLDLPEEAEVQLIPGRLFVSDTILATSGQLYRFVTLKFRDKTGATCQYKKLYYDGQTAYADDFVPYQNRDIVATIAGVNTKEVDADPKRGGGMIYTYKVTTFFVFAGHPRPIELPTPAAPEPGPAEAAAAPPEAWDAPLPEDILPAPAEEQPAAIMNPEQLAKEQRCHASMLEETMFQLAEREVFLALHDLSLKASDWTQAQLATFDDQLEAWYDAISEEKPIGHTNWDAPTTPAQREAILAIARRFPTEDDGKRFIKKRLVGKGLRLLKDLTYAGIECFRRELLADPDCPPA